MNEINSKRHIIRLRGQRIHAAREANFEGYNVLVYAALVTAENEGVNLRFLKESPKPGRQQVADRSAK